MAVGIYRHAVDALEALGRVVSLLAKYVSFLVEDRVLVRHSQRFEESRRNELVGPFFFLLRLSTLDDLVASPPDQPGHNDHSGRNCDQKNGDP